jgi:hypothetical protein
MVIAIPTHYRSHLIEKNALAFVQKMQMQCQVYVFVSNEEDLRNYEPLSRKYGFTLVNANTKTVKEKFNYIHQYWQNGQDVLLVEDDVSDFVSIIDWSIKKIVTEGFSQMHKHGKKAWGIYPSANKFFMSQTMTHGFGFLVANVYGFVADGDTRILAQEESKNDYERSVLYYIHKGGIVRLNYVAAKTKNYTTKGGMQLLGNRAEIEQTACDNLVRRFPSYVGYKKNTKSIYKEIRLLR